MEHFYENEIEYYIYYIYLIYQRIMKKENLEIQEAFKKK